MHTYISLLRGINVGGHKKIKMENLRALYEGLGFMEVRSYIQSGNLVFKTDATDMVEICLKIEEAIQAQYGFEVKVWIGTPAFLQAMIDENPFQAITSDTNSFYYTLLLQKPDEAHATTLHALHYPPDDFRLVGKVVYLYTVAYGKTKFSQDVFEKKLKVWATTRNHKTISTLIQLSETPHHT